MRQPLRIADPKMPSQSFFRVCNGLGVTEQGLLAPSRVFGAVSLNRQKVRGGGPAVELVKIRYPPFQAGAL